MHRHRRLWHRYPDGGSSLRHRTDESAAQRRNEKLFAEIAASFTDDREDSRNRDDGDVDAALPADTAVKEYRAPYLAHATMEPLNTTALLKDGRLDIWGGTQNQTRCRDVDVALTGGRPRSTNLL